MDEDQREIVRDLLITHDSLKGGACFGDCCLNTVEKRALIAALKYAMEVPVSGNQTGEEK